MLELYAAGTRFRKALDTLIRQAATGRMAPAEVDRFLAGKPDPGAGGCLAGSGGGCASMGLLALLEASGPALVIEALARPDSTVARSEVGGRCRTLRAYLHKLTGWTTSSARSCRKKGRLESRVCSPPWGRRLLCARLRSRSSARTAAPGPPSLEGCGG